MSHTTYVRNPHWEWMGNLRSMGGWVTYMTDIEAGSLHPVSWPSWSYNWDESKKTLTFDLRDMAEDTHVRYVEKEGERERKVGNSESFTSKIRI